MFSYFYQLVSYLVINQFTQLQSHLYFFKYFYLLVDSLSSPFHILFTVVFLHRTGYGFLLSFCWGTSVGNAWLSVSGFHMSHLCMLVSDHFLTSKCSQISLVCPIRSLLNLFLYCLLLLWELSHSSMRALVQCSLLELFFLSLCHST